MDVGHLPDTHGYLRFYLNSSDPLKVIGQLGGVVVGGGQ